MIIVQTMVFAAISVMLISALASWSATSIKSGRIAFLREQALQAAEAGIDYYRWHLAHAPADFQDGTGAPGPYVHTLEDKDGNAVAQFSLDITPPGLGSTFVRMQSTGISTLDPAFERTVESQVAKPSIANYAVAGNDPTYFVAGTEIFGPIHINGGIHFDGLAHNVVSSAATIYDDLEHIDGPLPPSIAGAFGGPLVTPSTIQLPTNSSTGTGDVFFSQRPITSTLWSRVSGPTLFNIVSPTTLSTTINNLVNGVYRFRIYATDNGGYTGFTDDSQGSILVNNLPSGSIIVSNCNIPTGASTCTGTVTWLTSNRVTGALTDVTKDHPAPGTVICSSPNPLLCTSGVNVNNTLSRGTSTFSLKHNGVELATAKSIAICATGNTWSTLLNMCVITVNPFPAVSAGADQNIQLPTNSVNVVGTATDANGIASTLWEKVSGPATFTITDPAALSTSFTNLVSGSYIFRLTATDTLGAVSFDEMTVAVSPLPTGTITARNCPITNGLSSCSSQVTWNVANPISGAPTEVRRNNPGSTVVADTLSGNLVGITANRGQSTFTLFHNGVELANANMEAYCYTAFTSSNWHSPICSDDEFEEIGVHTHKGVPPAGVSFSYVPAETDPNNIPVRQDVFEAGRMISQPIVDFGGFTGDIATLQGIAQTSDGFYRDAAGGSYVGYHIVLHDDNFDLYRINSWADDGNCNSIYDEPLTWSINTETFDNTYQYPVNGVIFIEDHVVVDGQIDGARITIIAADLPVPGSPANYKNIIINNDLSYTNYDGTDVIGLIAQGGVMTGLFSDNDLKIDAAMVAQNKKVGRFLYELANGGGECNSSNRDVVSLYGMIASYQPYTYTHPRAPVNSGYDDVNIFYDANLLYSPPPFFPLITDEYMILSWQEIRP